jgi:hypothetical protein
VSAGKKDACAVALEANKKNDASSDAKSGGKKKEKKGFFRRLFGK